MSELSNLLRELKIDSSLISPEDLKVLEQGIPVSESDDDLSESHSVGNWTPEPRQIDQTYMEKIQRAQELKYIKEDYERQIRELNNKCRELKKEKSLLEDSLENQRANFKNELRSQKEASEYEIDNLKSTLKKLQHEAPIVQERVEGLKEQLRDLHISEEHYYELKKLPEKDRNLRDWILCRVYEIVQNYRGNYDSNRKEIENLKSENTLLEEKLQRATRNLSHQETHLGSYVKDLERKHQELLNENTRIHKNVEHLEKLLEENRDKALRYDELNSEFKKELEQKYKLQQQVEAQVAQIKQITKDREETRALLETRSKEYDFLGKDKSYLSNQNSQLQEKIQRLEDRNDRLEIEIVDAKNSAQNYLNKLLEAKQDKTGSFEEKLQKEVEELRERHSKQLEELKANLNEVHERRIEYLKEAKEEAENKMLRTEQDLRDKTEAYDSLLLEFRSMQNRLEEQLQEARSELRIKSENLERVHNVYEDTIKALRHSKSENEMLRDKVDVLKQEFYKNESKCTQENADLKAQLAVARENLQQYALIEQELDDAIKNQNVQGFQAPTTSKRRIQQSLELAKQLQDKTKQLDALKSQNANLTSEVETLSNEVTLCKKMLSHQEQPYAYLVKQIEDKEKELGSLKREIKKWEQKHANLNAELEVSVRKNSELEQDIKDLLKKRDAIEGLKEMLGGLVEQPPEKRTTVKPQTQGPQAPQWFQTLKRKLKK